MALDLRPLVSALRSHGIGKLASEVSNTRNRDPHDRIISHGIKVASQRHEQETLRLGVEALRALEADGFFTR